MASTTSTGPENGTGFDGCQSEYVRIPYADNTLFANPEMPADNGP